jgi:hypothetical protein
VPLFAFTSTNMCFLGCSSYYGHVFLPETWLHFLTFVVICLCLLYSCWALYLISGAIYFRAIISHWILQLWCFQGLRLCLGRVVIMYVRKSSDSLYYLKTFNLFCSFNWQCVCKFGFSSVGNKCSSFKQNRNRWKF